MSGGVRELPRGTQQGQEFVSVSELLAGTCYCCCSGDLQSFAFLTPPLHFSCKKENLPSASLGRPWAVPGDPVRPSQSRKGGSTQRATLHALSANTERCAKS